MSYFTGAITVAEIKNRYAALCAVHHPARGGSEATYDAITVEYMRLLAERDGAIITDDAGAKHEYKYNAQREETLNRQIADTLARSAQLSGIKIMLVGTWLWVSNTQRTHAPELKQLKYRWHGKRQLWYWHAPQPAWMSKRRKKSSSATFEQLAAKYGYEELN